MAQFESTGLEGLVLSLEELAALPDGVAGEMLIAEGEVIEAAQANKVRELGLADSGQLAQSITVNRKLRRSKDGPYITVSPGGAREDGVRNAEVGFIHEFGAPKRKIKPKQWMRTANECAVDAAVDAAAQVYDRWLKSKGL